MLSCHIFTATAPSIDLLKHQQWDNLSCALAGVSTNTLIL
ncbi:hypothetical protein PULV_b0441 [Pseudoalteromonas ulvae UL12]|nr:hypothetical protein [Pseudoalteromonas ulvae UL12]